MIAPAMVENTQDAGTYTLPNNLSELVHILVGILEEP